MQTIFIALALAGSAGSQSGAHDPGRATPHIHFVPDGSLVLGDPISWRVEGLRPRTEYRVVAELEDEWGLSWEAAASYVSDEGGVLDPARLAPTSGDYAGVDPSGLFWAGEGREEPAGWISAPAHASPVTFSVLREEALVVRRTLVRWIAAPEVQELPLEGEGLVGRLYLPDGAVRRPAVVLLGGSGGGNLWQRLMAGLLASKGYPALALAYFNAPGLPARLERIPVEYVLDALVAFGESPAVDPSRIALIGYSKGAELALLAASLFEDVKAVVAYAPSCVVFQAFLPPDFPAISSWSRSGEDLPFVPLRGYRSAASSVENWMTYLGNEAAVAAASIPIEEGRAAVLLLSGRDDVIWPSGEMAERVMTRLRERDFDLPFVHASFPEAGHGIARPGYLPTRPTAARNGGTAAGTARAQVEGWQTLLGFLAAHL